MNCTDKERVIVDYFKPFQFMYTKTSNGNYIKSEKQQYEDVNSLIISAFHDVVYNRGVISIFTKSFLDDILSLELRYYCKECFDIAETFYKALDENYKNNFFDFCKFYANTSNGKKLEVKLFSKRLILDFAKILTTLAEKDFEFKYSRFLEQLINYASLS